MPVLISELDVQRKPVLHEGVARWYGVYVAHVVDIKDPESRGRVKVMLPWAPDAGIGQLLLGDSRDHLVNDTLDISLARHVAGEVVRAEEGADHVHRLQRVQAAVDFEQLELVRNGQPVAAFALDGRRAVRQHSAEALGGAGD